MPRFGRRTEWWAPYAFAGTGDARSAPAAFRAFGCVGFFHSWIIHTIGGLVKYRAFAVGAARVVLLSDGDLVGGG